LKKHIQELKKILSSQSNPSAKHAAGGGRFMKKTSSRALHAGDLVLFGANEGHLLDTLQPNQPAIRAVALARPSSCHAPNAMGLASSG